MKIGYARVSTKEQNLLLQIDALQQEGCEQIFQEKITASKIQRPELDNLLTGLRKGDIVVIWKLDRLGRSLKDLVNLMTYLQDKGVGLLSLNDHINTTTPTGKLTFHLFAALAEFERDIISERTQAGLAAARARGRKGGRPKGLSQKAEHTAIIAQRLYEEEDLSVQQICDQLSITKRTLYKYLRHRGMEIGTSRKKVKIAN